MPHLFLAGRLPEAALARLEAEPGITFAVADAPDAAAMDEGLACADGVLLRATPVLDAERIRRARRLKVVSRYGVGYDNVDVAALSAAGIPLLIVGDTNSTSVAEGAFFLMLAAARRGVAYHEAVGAGDWRKRDSLAAAELEGKRLLVVGFGRIGRKLAARAAAFAMRIAVHDPLVPPGDITSLGYEPASDLDSALDRAQFVSLHLPLSTGTAGLLSAARIARMRADAIIVNTSRGGLLDESALADALRAGTIAAAGIDVFTDEPPSPSNPLLRAPNVILSPHAAGLTREAADRMAVATVENALNVLAGRLDAGLVVNPGVLDAVRS